MLSSPFPYADAPNQPSMDDCLARQACVAPHSTLPHTLLDAIMRLLETHPYPSPGSQPKGVSL